MITENKTALFFALAVFCQNMGVNALTRDSLNICANDPNNPCKEANRGEFSDTAKIVIIIVGVLLLFVLFGLVIYYKCRVCKQKKAQEERFVAQEAAH